MNDRTRYNENAERPIDWDLLLADCVQFTQKLIQTPSMSREEADVADLIAAELARLNFDEVAIDEIGNVIGRLYGRDRTLPALVLNTHLDHVDPGDLALWPEPPYAGNIVGGRIIGRGACDIKGPLAVQVYAMAALKRSGRRPRRDVVFTGVVQEEIGGAGAQYWVENLDYPVALVVLGEPSRNNLALGHRGIVQMWVTFYGRSAHASAPEKGLNPNYALADFLQKLEPAVVDLEEHTLLGPTTVVPTIIEVDTNSPNVIPAWTRVLLDVRTAGESKKSLLAFVDRLAGDTPYNVTDAWCSEPTPLAADADIIFGYDTPADMEEVLRMRQAIADGMGSKPALTSYHFATDGRHFVPYDIPVVGFAPGEEQEAHTAGESIAIDQIADALRGYVQVILDF
ncbi:MAG: M20 family metallopeptidase [Candidatus Promineifilaceae bacterium]